MTDQFFSKKQGAAAMKHALLKSYLPKFVGMTGSTSVGNKVFYIDGFAGPGAYTSGEPGSPTIALELSRTMRRLGRDLCGICIEPDPANFSELEDCLSDATGWSAMHGTAEACLPLAVQRSVGFPAFLFLDPYGLKPLPFDLVADVLRRPGKTEVLIRVDTVGVKRIAGHVNSPNRLDATVSVGDRFFGGDWWHEFAGLDGESLVAGVLKGYAERLRGVSGSGAFWFPVHDKPGRQPKYWLVHVSNHNAAFWWMNEALSLWRERVEVQPDLFDYPDAWVATIADNVRSIINDVGSFVPRSRLSDVLGETLGKARSKHVRTALKGLYNDNEIGTSPVGVKDVGAMTVSSW